MKLVLSILIVAITTLTSYAQTSGNTGSKPQLNPKVYTIVEEMPSFPGGESALLEFISSHTKYPKKEQKNNIEGRVMVRFVVFEDGHVGDIQIIRSVSAGLDKEAIRVVRLLPDFKPGKQDGKPVSVYYNLPFSFKLIN